MRLPILIAGVLLASVQPAEATSPGCAMLAEGKSSRHALNLFYGSKAVEIMRAAQVNDRDALGQAVGPEFTYTVTDGDYIRVPRQTLGVDAVILLAGIIKPKSFRIETVYDGPLSMASTGCQWTVKVVFDSSPPPDRWPDGFAMEFTFSGDRLIAVKADSLQVSAGTLTSEPN